jgi:HSP20 family protein
MNTFVPEVDVEEHEDRYALTLDVPGVQKDDLKVEVEDRILRISGERKKAEHPDAKHTTWGRSYGTFTRAFSLPDDVDTESLEALHKDGVLRIEVKKTKENRSRLVAIK